MLSDVRPLSVHASLRGRDLNSVSAGQGESVGHRDRWSDKKRWSQRLLVRQGVLVTETAGQRGSVGHRDR